MTRDKLERLVAAIEAEHALPPIDYSGRQADHGTKPTPAAPLDPTPISIGYRSKNFLDDWDYRRGP